jgi:uncharacterized protein DUF4345
MLSLSSASERRLLQALVALVALVPVLAGLAGILYGLHVLDVHAGLPRDADSQVRYLSGLLFAIGLGFWSTVPRIDAQGARFRLLTALVVVGGFARLYASARSGLPGASMLAGLALELFITPGLAIWRERLERNCRERAPDSQGSKTVFPRQEARWPV